MEQETISYLNKRKGKKAVSSQAETARSEKPEELTLDKIAEIYSDGEKARDFWAKRFPEFAHKLFGEFLEEVDQAGRERIKLPLRTIEAAVLSPFASIRETVGRTQRLSQEQYDILNALGIRDHKEQRLIELRQHHLIFTSNPV